MHLNQEAKEVSMKQSTCAANLNLFPVSPFHAVPSRVPSIVHRSRMREEVCTEGCLMDGRYSAWCRLGERRRQLTYIKGDEEKDTCRSRDHAIRPSFLPSQTEIFVNSF